jgi:hypothetical protein
MITRPTFPVFSIDAITESVNYVEEKLNSGFVWLGTLIKWNHALANLSTWYWEVG